jgi:hypothetical protein
LRAAAALCVLWNLYGVFQFAGSFTQTHNSLMTGGMTASQASAYLSLPAWISVVFAVGVFGGLAASISLAARRHVAVPLFALLLVGYLLLFAGDAWYGVFASIPEQLAILGVVVLIAAALLWASWLARKHGLLR